MDAVYTSSGLFLEDFLQAVQAQHGLLIQRLGRHEFYVRLRSCLASSLRVVCVVLAALALDSVRRDELRRNHAGIQTKFSEFATPMEGATSGFYRHKAA